MDQFSNVELAIDKAHIYYISTIETILLSNVFYFNKCTATDQIYCVYV